jgi:UDP-N-acetylglucosamine--N-acetylmuramyl-(pentapeptide) pyrophosphoryl-undecaprenol N-acetylglucosamine transferase
LADQVFLSFERSLRYSSGLVCGNPVRREIIAAGREAARSKLGIEGDNKVLLVVGGSQGARHLNEVVLAALPGIGGQNWEVLHVIGNRDYDWVAARLPAGRYPFYHSFAYVYNIAELLAAADLVVSRAGATAIAEFLVRGLPMILVPFPFSAEKHQDLNAQAVADGRAAIVIKNADLSASSLVTALRDLDNELKAMGEAARRLARPDAAKAIVDLVMQRT